MKDRTRFKDLLLDIGVVIFTVIAASILITDIVRSHREKQSLEIKKEKGQ